MELEHSFTVPVPKSRAWDVLLDVERVAPCMPGASLDSVDGDEIRGRIKVKVGPINMTYAGTARFVERDAEAGVVTLEASGKETRGAGTASASVRSVLEDGGNETHVQVRTTLNVTGKPAQFGRGVMNEVGGKLLGIFAANLAATLAQEEAAPVSAGAAGEGATGEGATGEGATDRAARATSATNGADPASQAQRSTTQASGSTTAGAAASGAAGAGAGAAGAGAAGAGAAGAGAAESGAGKPLADAPVDELNLPARATSGLHSDGIATISQLATKTEAELLAIDGIGPATVDDIKSKLADLGRTLGQPPAAPATPPQEAASPATAESPAAAAASATASGAAPVVPHASAARHAAHQLEDDALNLLKVAGLPVLKRAVPVLAGVVAALLIGLRAKARRRKH